MKKQRILISLAATMLAGGLILSLPGCQLDELADGMRMQTRRLMIKASYENPLSEETKTVLRLGDDQKEHVYWVPGDAISLFYGSGTAGGSKFVAQATEETRVTNFSGEIGVVTGGDEVSEDDTYFWGLYPYDPESVCDGQTVTVKIEDNQIGAPDTFASGFAPSLGHDQGLMLSFRNVYCGLWFTVTETGYRSVTLRSNNGELISGRAKVGIGSDGYPEIREILSGTSTVSVTAPTPEGFIPGKKYYLLFFPQTLTAGFTLELKTVSSVGTFSVSSRVPFARNQISNVKNLDTRCTFAPLSITPDLFPDANFRSWVFSQFDWDGDNVLSPEECESVTYISLNVVNYDISSMQGIEFLPNLVELRCYGTRTWNSQQGKYILNGKLTSLDVSHNKKLERLTCYYNNLTSLDVSKNSALKYLDCGNDPLGSLDVSHNTELETLNCFGTGLTSLDVSKNTKLVNLYCDQNRLTELDVTHNPELQYLRCYTNQLTALDVSQNTKLLSLQCQNNRLTSLDVSHNPDLQSLYYGNNPFTEPVDFSACTELTSLGCYNLSLTSLNVSGLTKLVTLECGNNRLTSLDVSQNPALQGLYCYSNQITGLDLTANPEITDVDCEYNPIGALDFSANAKLRYLYCNDCSLQTVDVTDSPLLNSFYCQNNQLTAIDITNNPMLTYFDCRNNPLQTLYKVSGQAFQQYNIPDGVNVVESTAVGIPIDGEHFPDANFRSYVASNLDNGDGILTDIERENVESIQVNTDNITSVKGIELFPNLNYLSVNGSSRNYDDAHQTYVCSGQLTSLDLSGNTKLENLYCYYNNITSLDISANPNLKYLRCYGNAIGELDLSNNPLLETVYVSYNSIVSLDFSHNPAVNWLRCDNNLLTSLFLGGLDKLTMLNCAYNQLDGLDISDCVALETLYCYRNNLTSLNLRYNGNLNYLSCYYNQLGGLDLSQNPYLTYISCHTNQLTSLDLSLNTALVSLYCASNQLTSLDLSHNVALQDLSCGYNDLWSIDLSANTALSYIYVRDNANLGTVTLPQTLELIPDSAFRNCSSLAEIDIPASVTSIGNYAFYNATALKKVTMLSVTPPAGGTNMFRYTHNDLRLFVPESAVAAYKSAQYWSDYAGIISIPAAADNEDITYINW